MRTAFIVAVLFIGVLSPPDAHAQTTRTEQLLRVFLKTCVENMTRPEQLQELLKPESDYALPKMSEDVADFFLRGRAGDVWGLPPTLGKAVLALSHEGVCTIYVREWDEGDLSPHLEDFFTNTIQVYRLEETKRTPGILSSISYAVYPVSQLKAMLEAEGHSTDAFTSVVVSQSDKVDANFQLALSIGMMVGR